MPPAPFATLPALPSLQRRHPRRDVHAAAAARERHAGPWTRALDEHLWEPPSPCDSGLDLLKYELCQDYCIQEDILGSEDEFGDWDVVSWLMRGCMLAFLPLKERKEHGRTGWDCCARGLWCAGLADCRAHGMGCCSQPR